MRSNKYDRADELAKVLQRHLRGDQEGIDDGPEGMIGWAMMILAIRERGEENFSQTESRAQVSDLVEPINNLLKVLANLGRGERRRVAVALMRYLQKKQGTWKLLKVTSLEEMLKTFRDGLEWHRVNDRIMSQPRPLAHQGVDWRRVSVALACARVWALNAQRQQSAAWRRHTRDLPERLVGPDAPAFVILDRLDTFAPKRINRAVPGPFGRFLQDVLNVLPDRNSQGEPYDASDTLRALRRVQARKRSASQPA